MSRHPSPSRPRASKHPFSSRRRRSKVRELVLHIAPPAQQAVITILDTVALSNRRRAMALVEAISTLVLTLPRWEPRRRARRAP